MDIAEIENESLQAMGIVTGNSIVKVLKFQDPCWVNQKSSFEKDFSFFLPFFGGGVVWLHFPLRLHACNFSRKTDRKTQCNTVQGVTQYVKPYKGRRSRELQKFVLLLRKTYILTRLRSENCLNFNIYTMLQKPVELNYIYISTKMFSDKNITS